MKSSLWLRLSFLCAALLFALGCRTNLLPEYAGRIVNTHAEVRVPAVGTVSVATGRQTKKKKTVSDSIAQTAVGVAAANAAYSAQAKLQQAMPPERVARIVNKEVARRARSVGFPFVGDSVPTNTQLVVVVRRYGIEAAGDLSPASARFQLYGYLTYLPESKLIWEYTVFVNIPLASVHVASAGNSFAGDISNVVAIANLERRDIRRLFSAATRSATQQFMSKLTDDYQVGLIKWEAKYGAFKKPPPPTAPLPDDDDDEEGDGEPSTPEGTPPPPPPPPEESDQI